MATAAAPPPAASNKADLWGGLPIEVIVGTGLYGAGKTLFGLTIDPGPRTLVMDNEGSSTIYQSLGFRHIDMAAELIKKHPKGYTPEDRYLWWRQAAIEHGKSGNFTVLMVDPFSEIEDGLARYVEKNPQKFGYSEAQFKRSSGLYWSAMKTALAADLDMLRAMYQTVYLVVHMRNEFRGATPTGKKEPKGKETLQQLASLFLQFERRANDKGEVPAVPSAIVLKSRLAHTKITDEGVQILPILPPRIPKATPQAIREYIKAPPDYTKLKKDERAPEEHLSDDDKLLLQAQIAANNHEAAEAELQREAIRAKALEAQRAAIAGRTPAPDRSAELAANAEARAEAAAAELITADQLDLLKKLNADLYGADATPFRAILESYGVQKVRELTEAQAQAIIDTLSDALQERVAEKGRQLAATSPEQMAGQHKEPSGESEQPVAVLPNGESADESMPAGDEVAADAPEQPSPPGLVEPPIREDQAQAIRTMLREAAILPATFIELLDRFAGGKRKIPDLDQREAAIIATELRNRIKRVEEAKAADAAPLNDDDQLDSPPSPTPGSITQGQFDRINELAQSVGWPKDKRDAYLATCKVNSFRSLSQEQASACITKLAAALEKFQKGGQGGN